MASWAWDYEHKTENKGQLTSSHTAILFTCTFKQFLLFIILQPRHWGNLFQLPNSVHPINYFFFLSFFLSDNKHKSKFCINETLFLCSLTNQSTASFFQDHSMSLGRLIGIGPGDRGRLYFPNSIHFEEHGGVSRRVAQNSDVSGGEHGVDLCRGICIPLLLCALAKSSRSKSKWEPEVIMFINLVAKG